MFTRATGLLIVPLWLASMGWLVNHDVWPAWTAKEPPRVMPSEWFMTEGRQAQFTISDEFGPLGTIWTKYGGEVDTSVLRYDTIWIERFPLPIAPLRVNVNSVFDTEGLLDTFEVAFETRSLSSPIKLHGERFHAHFSFTLKTGTAEQAFKIPLIDGGLISGAFQPFAQLADLHVGETWRMHVFNPVAVLTGVGDRFTSILVKVTGRETIITKAGPKTCYVLESPHAQAWVDDQGVVWLQEAELPVVGRLRVVREAEFDETALAVARNFSFRRRQLDRR